MVQFVRPVALAAGALLLWTAAGTAQATDELPEGVTQAMIAEGQTLFGGQGLCMACHGQDAKGIPNLGSDLSDKEWTHSDGSLEGILNTIVQGVAPDKSATGTVMPPKGGTSLADAQLKAIAAYVWSLTRNP